MIQNIEKIQDDFIKTLKDEFNFVLDEIESFSSKEIKIKVVLFSIIVRFYIKNNSFDYDFDTSNTVIYDKIYRYYSANMKLLRYIFKEYLKTLYTAGF